MTCPTGYDYQSFYYFSCFSVFCYVDAASDGANSVDTNLVRQIYECGRSSNVEFNTPTSILTMLPASSANLLDACLNVYCYVDAAADGTKHC